MTPWLINKKEKEEKKKKVDQFIIEALDRTACGAVLLCKRGWTAFFSSI